MTRDAFAPALLRWYAADGRKGLPWQVDRSPYRVWVSEIMLQQTQVASVLDYYARFMARFPDVGSLADATLDEVLHLWSGLGYYARARNLHRAAKVVVNRHRGDFPTTLEAVMELPGIGRSTAGAILALSRDERHPILDGNVKRVLTRYFGIAGFPGEREVERRLWELADRCTPPAQVADYTQAIMDLGATVCTRANPACLLCPVSAGCVARTTGEPQRYPTPRPRKARPQREAWLVLARRGREVLLEKRPPTGIWGGLWGLPEFPTRAHASQWCQEHLATNSSSTFEAIAPLRHAFSHFDLEMRPLVVQCSDRVTRLHDDARYRWYDPGAPAAVGLPKPIAVLLERAARA